jgi:hypothetical protein
VQHDIKVEQYFKNSKSQQMITVYGPNIYNEKWFYPKFFNQGDRALFYLKKIDDKYIILEHSILATEKCSPRDMIGLSTLPGEPIGRGGPTLFFDPYQTCNPYLYSVDYLTKTLSPIKQLAAGIQYSDVQCRDGFELVVKTTSGHPFCVKPESVEKLIERGWATIRKTSELVNPEKYMITKNEQAFQIQYSLKGAILDEITSDIDSNSIHVKLNNTVGGQLVISIPRGLIDAKMGYHGQENVPDDVFFILIDGREYLYGEKSNESERTLTILFPRGAHDIEIIGTNLI